MNFIFYNLFIPCPFENSLRNICKLLVYSCYSIVFTFEFNSVLVELQKKLLFYYMQISGNGGCHLRFNTKSAKFSLCCGISVQTGWDLEDLKDIEHISTQLIIQCSSMFSYIKPHFENIKISLMIWFNDLRHSNQSESLFYWESCTPFFLMNQIKIIRKDSKIVWKALNR